MTQQHSSRNRLIAYWTVTGLLVAGMFAGGLAQLLGAQWNKDGFIHLGYPVYFMHLVGAWKVLGVIALVVPGYPRLKEWAYAGFFFVMTGAVISHLASGDGLQGVIYQSIFVILIVVSWALRPASRRIEFTQQTRTPQFA
jgi:uncharacterized membrane protein YphA (DoxX/SURF4 family)